MNEEFAFWLTNGKQTKKISLQKSHILEIETSLKKKDAFSTEIWNFVKTWPTYLKYLCGGWVVSILLSLFLNSRDFTWKYEMASLEPGNKPPV